MFKPMLSRRTPSLPLQPRAHGWLPDHSMPPRPNPDQGSLR